MPGVDLKKAEMRQVHPIEVAPQASKNGCLKILIFPVPTSRAAGVVNY